MRYLFRVGYVGWKYHGLARQPDVRTVEGEIINVLTERGYIEDPASARFMFSSRTDAGVSAFANTFACDLKKRPVLGEINAELDGIWVWAYREVERGFDPRKKARLRRYRYFFPGKVRGEMLREMQRAAEVFVGRHDFTAYSIPEGKTVYREVIDARVYNMGVTVFDVAGRSFLRQMVRRMAFALWMVGTGEWDAEEVRRRLEEKVKVPPMPPEGLVLVDVHYPFGFFVDREWLGRMMDFWKKMEKEAWVRLHLARSALFLEPEAPDDELPVQSEQEP